MRTVGYVITGGKPLHKSHVAFIKAKRKKKVELPRSTRNNILLYFQLACTWSTHQDNWSQGKNCWCGQEKELKCNVLLIMLQ